MVLLVMLLLTSLMMLVLMPLLLQPTPSCFALSTDKEETVSLQALVKVQPRFCRHCELLVLSGGLRKKKVDIPFLNQERYELMDYSDEDVVFCSDVCFALFDEAQRNAVRRVSKVCLLQPTASYARRVYIVSRSEITVGHSL